MINQDEIKGILQQVAYNYDEPVSVKNIQEYLVNHLCINTYVKYVKGKDDEPTWRPHIEPYKMPAGIEFNYVYKDWSDALWASIVAACVYRLNRAKFVDEILDITMDVWKRAGLKPDFKIKPKPQTETKEQPKGNPGQEKLKQTFADLFGGGGISNPFSKFGL